MDQGRASRRAPSRLGSTTGQTAWSVLVQTTSSTVDANRVAVRVKRRPVRWQRDCPFPWRLSGKVDAPETGCDGVTNPVWRRAIPPRTLALGPRICQSERQRPRRRVGWLCVTNNGDCLGDSLHGEAAAASPVPQMGDEDSAFCSCLSRRRWAAACRPIQRFCELRTIRLARWPG